jgi:ABC-type Zn uptake system ZnuABC Zn-binding protein ZnuA
VASDALKVYVNDIREQLRTGHSGNKDQLRKKLKDATEQKKQIANRWHS